MKKVVIMAMMMISLIITGCSSEDYYVEEDNGRAVTESNNGEKTVIKSNDVEEENDSKIIKKIDRESTSEKEKISIDKPNQESCKELYLKKLAELDKLTNEEEDKNQPMTPMSIGMADLAEKWDDMLNEIYGVLKGQLSTSEMDALRVEQRAWIKYRDKNAEEARDEYEGGTLAPYMYSSSVVHDTRERCYVLVNDYMK